MEQTQQYKTLDYVIGKVKTDFEILGTSQDLRIRSMCCDVFRDMNQFGALPTIQTAILKVDKHGVAEFPDDYQEYYKIGLHHCGRILNLTANDQIALTPRCDCHTTQEEFQCCVDDLVGVRQVAGAWGDGGVASGDWSLGQMWNYLPGFHNGQYVAGFYGNGAGVYRGGYRINEQERYIQLEFRGCHDKEIAIEYKSSGGIDTGNAYIPVMAVDCLIYGVKTRLCENSINPAWANKTQLFATRYSKRIKRTISHIHGMTPTEILQIVRSSFTQLPKR